MQNSGNTVTRIAHSLFRLPAAVAYPLSPRIAHADRVGGVVETP